MRIFNNISIATYDEWRKAKYDTLLPEHEFECPDCDGSGESECECCGHQTDCEECEGSGVIDSLEFDKYFPSKRFYVTEAIEDIRRLSSFTSTDFFLNLCAAKNIWIERSCR